MTEQKTYRIDEIMHGEKDTFNTWYNDEIMDKLSADGYRKLIDGLGCNVKIPIDYIKKELMPFAKGTLERVLKKI